MENMPNGESDFQDPMDVVRGALGEDALEAGISATNDDGAVLETHTKEDLEARRQGGKGLVDHAEKVADEKGETDELLNDEEILRGL